MHPSLHMPAADILDTYGHPGLSFAIQLAESGLAKRVESGGELIGFTISEDGLNYLVTLGVMEE